MNTFKDLRASRLSLMYSKYGDLAATITEALMNPNLHILDDKIKAYSTFKFKVNPGEAASVLFFIQELKFVTGIPVQATLVKDTIHIAILEEETPS